MNDFKRSIRQVFNIWGELNEEFDPNSVFMGVTKEKKSVWTDFIEKVRKIDYVKDFIKDKIIKETSTSFINNFKVKYDDILKEFKDFNIKIKTGEEYDNNRFEEIKKIVKQINVFESFLKKELKTFLKKEMDNIIQKYNKKFELNIDFSVEEIVEKESYQAEKMISAYFGLYLKNKSLFYKVNGNSISFLPKKNEKYDCYSPDDDNMSIEVKKYPKNKNTIVFSETLSPDKDYEKFKLMTDVDINTHNNLVDSILKNSNNIYVLKQNLVIKYLAIVHNISENPKYGVDFSIFDGNYVKNNLTLTSHEGRGGKSGSGIVIKRISLDVNLDYSQILEEDVIKTLIAK